MTSSGALSTGRRYLAGAGTQTAGLAIGGYTGQPAGVNNTEEFGGSSWTTGGTLSPTTWASAGTGTQTAALKAGGAGEGSPGPTAGTNTAALAVGNTPAATTVEEYTGTTETITANTLTTE